MPPRLRLINRLLRAETTEEQNHLFSEEPSLVDQKMLGMIDELITPFTASDQATVVKRLAALREEVNVRASNTSDATPDEAVEESDDVEQ